MGWEVMKDREGRQGCSGQGSTVGGRERKKREGMNREGRQGRRNDG